MICIHITKCFANSVHVHSIPMQDVFLISIGTCHNRSLKSVRLHHSHIRYCQKFANMISPCQYTCKEGNKLSLKLASVHLRPERYYILYIIYYLLYTIQYILHVTYCISYTIYYILYTIYYILYTIYYILHATYYTLNTIYYTSHIIYYILYSI